MEKATPLADVGRLLSPAVLLILWVCCAGLGTRALRAGPEYYVVGSALYLVAILLGWYTIERWVKYIEVFLLYGLLKGIGGLILLGVFSSFDNPAFPELSVSILLLGLGMVLSLQLVARKLNAVDKVILLLFALTPFITVVLELGAAVMGVLMVTEIGATWLNGKLSRERHQPSPSSGPFR